MTVGSFSTASVAPSAIGTTNIRVMFGPKEAAAFGAAAAAALWLLNTIWRRRD